MQRNRPLSSQAICLLLTLANNPSAWQHGYELCQATGLKAGSLYPILMRLADRGWLEAKWEERPSAGRPPRHLYRLTATGRSEVRELAKTHASSPAAPPTRLRVQPEGS